MEELQCALASTTGTSNVVVAVTPGSTLTSVLRSVAQGDGLRHSHWRSFDPLPPWQHRLIGVYMTVLGLTAVMGNILVVWACVR
ncbi:hypothetical protein ACOMHN_026794 [Nucella lapillus]